MNVSAAGLQLDGGTLVFALSMLSLSMAAISFLMSRRNAQNGLAEWGCAMACFAVGFLLIFLRGYMPWALTYLVANFLVWLAASLWLVAFSHAFAAKVPRRVIACGTVFGLGGVLAVFFLEVSNRLAIFTLSLAVALMLSAIALTAFQNRAKVTSRLNWVTCSVFGATAAMLVVRASLVLIQPPQALSPGASSAPQVTILILGSLFVVLSTVCFLGVVDERRQREAIGRLRRDALTGLYTRTAFHEMTDEIAAIGATEGLSVVMFDIDHFKSINDTYGHSGGDVALAHAARLIGNSIRLTDVAVRYGGEEFCVVMRGCARPDAANFAERIVAQARQQAVRLSDGRTIRFTLSAGYACMQAQPALSHANGSLGGTIELADQALYRAKHGGRNRAIPAWETSPAA